MHATLLLLFTIPVTLVLWTSKALRVHSCYKIMAVMSLADVLSLIMAITSGILSIVSIPFCHPVAFVFLRTGTTSIFSIWVLYTTMSVVLALNRTIVMTCYPLTINRWFGGQKWIYWTVGVLIYMCVVSAPGLTAWTNVVYHTGVGYFIRDVLTPTWFGLNDAILSGHNASITISLICCYVVFLYRLRQKTNKITLTERSQMLEVEKAVQLLCITQCAITALAAIVYAFQPYLPALLSDSETFLVFCQCCWIWCHGINGVLSVMLNQTMREELFKIYKIAFIPKTSTTRVFNIRK